MKKTFFLSQSSIALKFVCPVCSSSYIGKTDRTLFFKKEEHAYPNKSKNDQSVSMSTCLLAVTIIIQMTY